MHARNRLEGTSLQRQVTYRVTEIFCRLGVLGIRNLARHGIAS